MKRCPLCEREYESGEYCQSCGVLLQSDGHQKENHAVSGSKVLHNAKEKKLMSDEWNRTNGSSGSKSHITSKSVAAVLVLVVIAACSIFAIKLTKNLSHPSSGSISSAENNMISQGEFIGDDTDSQSNHEDSCIDTEKSANSPEQDNYNNGWHSILSENSFYTDINQCLDLNNYLFQMSEDESFAFAYPIHFFQKGYIRDDGQCYDFICSDETYYAKLQVFKRQNMGDPVLNCMNTAQEYVDEWESIQYTHPADKEPRVDEHGMARQIVMGVCSKADAKMEYVIAANDGQYDYIMDFQYKDPQPENDYDEIGYILDCLYRYCSFSGGTYQPRTYRQFLEGDMGEKKAAEKSEDDSSYILNESDREYISD